MLVLSRKERETIIINGGTADEIQVVVLGIDGNTIRLGVEAPKHVAVNRLEIQQSLERQNYDEMEG